MTPNERGADAYTTGPVEDPQARAGAAMETTTTPDLAEALRGVSDPGERLYLRVYPVAIDPGEDSAGAWASCPEWERAEWRRLAAAIESEARARALSEAIEAAEKVREVWDRSELAAIDDGSSGSTIDRHCDTKVGAALAVDALRALAKVQR